MNGLRTQKDFESFSISKNNRDNAGINPDFSQDFAALAVELRLKYYDRKKRAFSYADAIHLATALIAGCDQFYTGDSDFAGIDENLKINVIARG